MVHTNYSAHPQPTSATVMPSCSFACISGMCSAMRCTRKWRIQVPSDLRTGQAIRVLSATKQLFSMTAAREKEQLLFAPARAADRAAACLVGHVVVGPAPASQETILQRRAPDGFRRGSDEACTQCERSAMRSCCGQICGLSHMRRCRGFSVRVLSSHSTAEATKMLRTHVEVYMPCTGTSCWMTTDLPRTWVMRRTRTHWSGPSAAPATDGTALLLHRL